MALELAQHLVYSPCGIPGAASPSNHRRGGPCSPEEELRAGRLYLEFSWPFVLRPLDADRTRLMLRAHNNVSPNGWPGSWMSRSAWWTSRLSYPRDVAIPGHIPH
jgi:hypothetical protein